MAEQTDQQQTDQQQRTQALVIPDPEADRLARIGTWLAATEGSRDPKGPDGMAGAMRLLIAKEYGWPVQAATEVYVIKGTITLSAKMKRALALRDGYQIDRAELDDEHCTARVLDRNGQLLGETTFTMDEARKVGLDTKENYKHWPQRMLWARASARVIDDFIPHVVLGFKTREDVDDDFIDAEAVEVVEEGTET